MPCQECDTDYDIKTKSIAMEDALEAIGQTSPAEEQKNPRLLSRLPQQGKQNQHHPTKCEISLVLTIECGATNEKCNENQSQEKPTKEELKDKKWG